MAAVGTGRTTPGILELEPVTAEDVVLVPSAAGGIGWLLVQHARSIGATVVAAAGGAVRTGRLTELDPDLVVDYREDGWAERVRSAYGGVAVVRRGRGRRRPHLARAAASGRSPGHVRVLGGRSDQVRHR